MLTHLLNIPGEHDLWIPGGAGVLEGKLTVPPQSKPNYIAILGHPHSLQGGTMNNKVVTTLVRALKELNVPSIRVNFRGVGQSEGYYDAGVGESDDLLMIAKQCMQENVNTRFIFAGFSFGSYVTYRVAAQCAHDLLISIAPAVHHYDYSEFENVPNPWVIIQGEEDEVVSLDLVQAFVAQAPIAISLRQFPETTHFFHGKLLDLKACLLEMITEKVPALCP